MMPRSVPKAFQTVTHLGAPVRVFSPWRAVLPWLAFPLYCAVPVLVVWKLGVVGADRLAPRLWLGLGVVWLLQWVGVAAITGRRLRDRAVVYEEGFARRDGKEVKAYRWEDVRQVSLSPRNRWRSSYGYRIAMAGGEGLDLMQSPHSLGKAIREQTFALRRERLTKAFEDGKALDFGGVTVSKAGGVRRGDEAHPWGDVRRMTVHAGELVCSMTDDSLLHTSTISCPLGLIPDPDVLLGLARSMGVEADLEAVKRLA
jgi:hypothetical protein